MMNTTTMLVRDTDNKILRPAHDFEIAQIRATRFGVSSFALRCGSTVCRLEQVDANGNIVVP